MTDRSDRIERARIEAAEQEVIAGIPADIMASLAIAQAEHRAKGGCPGCGSMVLAVHNIPCRVADDDLY
jgi:hypothetical protein